METALLTDRDEDNAHLEAIVRSVSDAILTVDSRGAIDYVNPAAERLFGYPADQLLGRSFAALLTEPHREEYAGYLRQHAQGETVGILGINREVIGRRGDGLNFAMELAITDLRPMEQRMLVAVACDIRERKRTEAELRRAADTDAVTGLLNRQAFERELTRHVEYATRYGSGGSVLMFDIDNFKYVAETVGTDAGDELLVTLSGLIRSRLRRTDLMARLGSDEFGILVHGVGRARARTMAEELLELTRDHAFAVAKQSVRITLSAGISTLEERPITGKELLTEAEVAMYSAKEAGRDRVSEYTDEDKEDVEAKRMWSERVRNATEKGLFVLVSQPISEVESGRITQHELLLRMRGEDGDLVPPAVFLATAERFGLIGGVDRWVTQQAMRLIASHRDDGNELHLEVNLSGHTMGDENFAAQVERELTATKIDPALLTFEITETAAVADVDRARQMALDLKALGCKFALDDFGAGFASFYYVKHLPIDYLKIDGEFIKDLPQNKADRLVVKALVDVCRGLEIKTIAEFVQDAETVAILRELGVDYAQGYFIGHPQPVAHLREGGEPASSNGDSPDSDEPQVPKDLERTAEDLRLADDEPAEPEEESPAPSSPEREWSLAADPPESD